MHIKAPIPTLAAPERPTRAGRIPPIIEAYFEFCHLKQLYRQGWLQRGVPPERCESVAEHSFGVTLLAVLLAEAHFPDLDAEKVIRIALLHDLGEIYAGDLTPADNVDADEKHRRERVSVEKVLLKLPRGARYVALWEEYERQETPEAQFVRQIDRLEMALQASVYEHQQLADLGEFFTSAGEAVTLPELRAVLEALKGVRDGCSDGRKTETVD